MAWRLIFTQGATSSWTVGPRAADEKADPKTASRANLKGVAVRPSTFADALDLRPANSKDRYESAAPWCASSMTTQATPSKGFCNAPDALNP
jgi:hypothetical protein